MSLLLFADAPPWFNLDILFLLVAGLIAVVGRVVQAARAYRKRTAALERDREQVDRVTFEEQGADDRDRARATFEELRDAFRPVEEPLAAPTAAPQPPPAVARLPLREPPRQRERALPPPLPATGRQPPPRAAGPATTARARARASRSALSRAALRHLSGDPKRVRQAILLREILDRPRALRGPLGAWHRGAGDRL